MMKARVSTISITKRASGIASRQFANLLPLSEEFPFPKISPQPATAPVVTESLLPNGTKIVTRETGGPVASVAFSFVSGSRAEGAAEKGAAQLLAATAFAGNAATSGLRLVRTLDNLGASVNAYASRELVTFEVSSLSDKAPDAVAAVADAIAAAPAPHHVYTEFVSEAGLSSPSDPATLISELIHDAAFGEGSPLGSPLYSPLTLPASSLLAYRAANITSSNAIVVGSNIPHNTLKQIIETAFFNLPKGTGEVSASPYIGGDVKIRADLGGLSYVAFALPVPVGDAAKPYKVLFNILADKFSSKPAAGTITPFFNQYTTGGLIGFVTSGTPEVAVGLLEGGVAELKALSKSASVDAAKNKVSLQTLLNLEGEGTTCTLLSAALTGLPVASAVDVSGVTAASVSAAAAAALKSTPSYAVLGKTLGTPSYASILKLTQ